MRELRRLELRPACQCYRAGAANLTVGIAHEPGEELQLDWLELSETPWGAKAHLLVGALSHSGRLRAVPSDGESSACVVTVPASPSSEPASTTPPQVGSSHDRNWEFFVILDTRSVSPDIVTFSV